MKSIFKTDIENIKLIIIITTTVTKANISVIIVKKKSKSCCKFMLISKDNVEVNVICKIFYRERNLDDT